MKSALIVSVVGPDQPGLVERLSRVVTEAGGNWEGSRLIQLGGQFAGMVRVVIPEDQVASLSEKLSRLSENGLAVTVVHSSSDAGSADSSGSIFLLEVVGQDRSGIVAAISEVLAKQEVNVIELATDCREAPWSGERLFHTTATIQAPEGVDLDALRNSVEEIAGDLMVEMRPEES